MNLLWSLFSDPKNRVLAILWIVVLAVAGVASYSVYTAINRITIDSESVRNINAISERLERTAKHMDGIVVESRENIRLQTALYEKTKGKTNHDYEVLKKKYGVSDTGVDDFSSKWLFPPTGGERSKQSTPDKNPTNPN